MIDETYLDAFLEDEVNFHRECKCPLWMVILCRLFRKKTPQEAVVHEIEWIRLYSGLLADTEAEKAGRTYTLKTDDPHVSMDPSEKAERDEWQDAGSGI